MVSGGGAAAMNRAVESSNGSPEALDLLGGWEWPSVGMMEKRRNSHRMNCMGFVVEADVGRAEHRS